MSAKSGWEKTRIADICILITSGGTPSRKVMEYYDGSIPWFKTGELKDWYLFDSEEKISNIAIKSSSAKIYPLNTILMAMYGDGRTIGSLGITKISAASNQACCAMTVDENKCHHLFLFYSLQYYRREIVSLALGGAQRNLNQATIKNFQMDLPSLKTQLKIASILSAYDELIENNTRRIKILEKMAQALYREWFVNFRFPGHEQVKMVDSPLGMMPEEWEVKRLGEVCSLIKRGVPPKYDDLADGVVINQKCIRDFRLSLKESRKHNTKVPVEKYLVQGDVLLNSTGVGTLGRVAQVLKDIPGCTVDSHVTIVRPRDLVDSDFLGLQLFELQGHFESLGLGATGQTELGREAIANTGFILAGIEIQKKFSSVVKPMRFLAEKLSVKNQNLRQTRELLLPKLIAGEVDVTELTVEIKGDNF